MFSKKDIFHEFKEQKKKKTIILIPDEPLHFKKIQIEI